MDARRIGARTAAPSVEALSEGTRRAIRAVHQRTTAAASATPRRAPQAFTPSSAIPAADDQYASGGVVKRGVTLRRGGSPAAVAGILPVKSPARAVRGSAQSRHPPHV